MVKRGYHFPKRTIRDIPVRNKRILLRADFNVPLNDQGEITSDFRITQTLPTIQYLLERGCTLIIASHLGRPEGKKDMKFTLQPVFERLKELLPSVALQFAPDAVDDGAWQLCKRAPKGSVTLLENLRFYPGEEANDSEFAKSLRRVSCAEYFVQDGFSVVHRAHASTEAITRLLPSVAGLLLENEVTSLTLAIQQPQHPLVAVIGGAKIADKIPFIERLLALADTVLIGGAMANTFLKQQGNNIGKSLYEVGQEQEIVKILHKSSKGQIVLPIDVGVAKEIEPSSPREESAVNAIAPDDHVLDIGFETMRLFNEHLKTAATVIWNGPLGMSELPHFAQGSEVIAQSLSDQYGSLTSIIGGGDTADLVLDWQTRHPHAQFNHISTGGGASLELMSGLKLPGLEALLDA